MTIVDTITTVLGPVWWYCEHDWSAVAAALDLVMEREGWDLVRTLRELLITLDWFRKLALIQGDRDQQREKVQALNRIEDQLRELFLASTGRTKTT
jgi:hypothetical protein